MIINREVLDMAFADQVINASAYNWALNNMDYLSKPMKLLTTQSTKTLKGEKKGYTTGILYLQPADKVAVKTICAGAKMAGCLKICLIQSGHLGMTNGQAAATKRTILFLLYREQFEAQLRAEIKKLYIKHGDSLAIRLNGTSDIDWTSLIASMPEILFYDYTKVYQRVLNNSLSNYDLTFSGSAFSSTSLKIAARAILNGKKTVLAFNTKEAKGEYSRPAELADFDDTDLRFLDAPGTVGALKRKGSNKLERSLDETMPSFFFNNQSYQQLRDIIARG